MVLIFFWLFYFLVKVKQDKREKASEQEDEITFSVRTLREVTHVSAFLFL